MVQRLIPALGCGNSYVQVVLDLGLPNEVLKAPGAETGFKGYIFSAGFTRYNALYFNLTPSINDPIISHPHLSQDKSAIK